MDYKEQITLISIEAEKNIEEIKKQAEIETRILRSRHNDAIKSEAEGKLLDIETNYQCGFIDVVESVAQKIAVLQVLHKNLFSFEQTK